VSQNPLTYKIAFVGNPNVGKSSLFNTLTGLKQKVGNFPGVTVERKIGFCKLDEQKKVEIVDLPGIYSLFVKTPDEKVVLEALLDKENIHYPDLIVFFIDALNLERSLVLYSQIKDLGFPLLPVITMFDLASNKGIEINLKKLEENLQSEVIAVNARKGVGVAELKKSLSAYQISKQTDAVLSEFEEKLSIQEGLNLPFLNKDAQQKYREKFLSSSKDIIDLQLEDTIDRMNKVHVLLNDVISYPSKTRKTLTEKIDSIVTHPVLGYLVYFGVLMLMFQFIFSLAEYPMSLIENAFSSINGLLKNNLSPGLLTDLLTEGIITGISGVVIFIPQIALLFAFISVLEESGYMSRVVYLMDKPMRVFGLSGKSVVPLISGAACAVPAIMSARGIENWKERMLTIFVTPFISCSARLPVYIIIIALIIPDVYFWGFSAKGLTLLFLYLLGILIALLTSVVFSIYLKSSSKNLFVIDIPSYKTPRWKNVFNTIFQKTKTFVLEAGKIILTISVLLWALASYGPGSSMEKAEKNAAEIVKTSPELNYEEVLAAQKLEASYIGQFGHFIEPVIRPLGYDWKIGIALITSFAAREVFVGTLGTIYSVGEENFDEKLVDKMRKEKFAGTDRPVYTFATGFSLLIFYVFALQCLSTIAVVYRETNSWKWTLSQFVYMTALAYILSLLTYNILS
jgi:ferrous iron transport protein B